MAATLRETVSVRKTAANVYTAEAFRDRARQGNVFPIAYGGIALSQALSAGQATISDLNFHLYSAQGTYLGPASTEVSTQYKVDVLRDTRSFCTRLVTATQNIDGKERNVLVVLMDWHVLEKASMLEYSTPPWFDRSEYSEPEKLSRQNDFADATLPPREAESFRTTFPLFADFYNVRPCMSSKAAQNIFGWLKTETTQDHLPLTRRTNSSWFKTNDKLEPHEQAAALGFFTDGALAFLPLTFTDQPLPAASACSSLDFSLRIFEPFNLSDWHLQEQHTEAGGNARTFSIGRVWDRSGKEIANMTQTSILRPKKAKL